MHIKNKNKITLKTKLTLHTGKKQNILHKNEALLYQTYLS